MDMAILQFYRNQFMYPRYKEGLTAYGSPMDCTPVGVNLRSGTLRVKGEFSDFMACNYLSLTRDGRTIFAWIDDVRFRSEDSFEVNYTVDAWRTYKGKIALGTQFIHRSQQPTYLKDNLLGSVKPYRSINTVMQTIGQRDKRVLVVQCRNGSDSIFSNTPVQPTPYMFFLCEFNVNNWQATAAIQSLMSYLSDSAESLNIVTMYSIPYVDISSVPSAPLIVVNGSGSFTIDGFKLLGTSDHSGIFHIETPVVINEDVNELMKVDHSVQLVIPEAGIISIPDELLFKTDLKLRQDIDLFSGASNYMLKSDIANYYTHSVRGSSISSIPIVSDPFDTYMSQNQNSLATSLIGDVASIAMGAGILASTGGIGAALGGGAGIAGGLNGLMNTAANIDTAMSQKASNPPAFLGTALASKFNQTFWVVTTKTNVENEQQVHDNFGYPFNMVADLTFPAAGGYIKTQGCNVSSTDGSVPRWALEEINRLFDNGILVKA